MSRKLIWIFIALGIIIRVFLLIVSKDNLGYYGGDALRYLDIAHMLKNHQWFNETLYPIGYPALLALSVALFGSIFPVPIFAIGVYATFTFWLCAKLQKLTGTSNGAVFAAFFLSLEPVWLTQTLIIGSDFFGSIFFGIGFIKLLEMRAEDHFKPRDLFMTGLLLGLASLFKPVYLYMPFIFWTLIFLGITGNQKSRAITALKAFAGLLLGWAVFVGPYTLGRSVTNHHYSFSGHSILLFGRYIVGTSLVAQGESDDLYKAMDLAESKFVQRHLEEPSLTWKTYIAQTILHKPFIFAKLMAVSAFKAVFGHANVNIIYFFTGKEVQGPGLWIAFSRGGGLWEKFSGIPWLWLSGMVIEFLLKLLLVTGAALGGARMFRLGLRVEAAVSCLLIFYFALSPVVFGEPRYFLPGTLCCLYLLSFGILNAKYSFKKSFSQS